MALAGAVEAAPLAYIPSDAGVGNAERTMYGWRVTRTGTGAPSGAAVTGTSLFNDDIFAAETNPDRLFVHLLDTARSGGLGLNALALDRRGGNAASAGTGARASARRSFLARPAHYSYDFNRAQTMTLSEYLASGGDVATALDPDCPFFDERLAVAVGSRLPREPSDPGWLAWSGYGSSGLEARVGVPPPRALKYG